NPRPPPNPGRRFACGRATARTVAADITHGHLVAHAGRTPPHHPTGRHQQGAVAHRHRRARPGAVGVRAAAVPQGRAATRPASPARTPPRPPQARTPPPAPPRPMTTRGSRGFGHWSLALAVRLPPHDPYRLLRRVVPAALPHLQNLHPL